MTFNWCYATFQTTGLSLVMQTTLDFYTDYLLGSFGHTIVLAYPKWPMEPQAMMRWLIYSIGSNEITEPYGSMSNP